MDEETVLSSTNWRDAILNAIDELPEDIKVSVGYSNPGEKAMRLTVAGEPVDEDDGESYVSAIEVQWWDTMTDQGWPPEFDSVYGPGGTLEERAGWPVVSVSGESRGFDEGVHPGRATVRNLKHMVQRAILDEMFQAGRVSLVSQDESGRYCYDDGSLILDWQRDAD